MKKISLLALPLLALTLSCAPKAHRAFATSNSLQNLVKSVTTDSWGFFDPDNYQPLNMFDGDSSTIAYTTGVYEGNSAIIIEFTESIVINDIFMSFSVSSTDWLPSGTFYYSNDETNPTYYKLDTYSINEKQDVHVNAYGYQARFLKLVAEKTNNGSWVQISEIDCNTGYFASDLVESVTYSIAQGRETNYSLNTLFDDDDTTYARFHRPENGEYILIKLSSLTSISSVRIRFYEDSDDEIMNGARFSYSVDNSSYTNFDTFSSFIGRTYAAQYVDVRDNPVNALYIKLTITSYKGWMKIADISFNNIPDAQPSFIVNGPTSIYQGALANILDSSSDTHAWFDNNVSSFVLDLRSVYQINSIDVQTGKADPNDHGDTMEGELQYSTNGVDYTKIADYSGDSLQEFASINVKARYIRLTNTRGGWSAIRIIDIDKSATKYVSISGLTPIAPNDDLDSVIDDNINDAFWCDWHYATNSYIQVEYTEAISASNIVFLQEGYVSNGSGYTSDHFTSSKLEYSLDGSSWTKVGDYTGESNILYTFASSTSLRFIRMTYTGNELSSIGVAIREFDANFVKHSITSSFISDPSYSDASFKGYSRLPYGLDLAISYTNLRTSVTSSDVPTEISKYQVSLSSAGNAIYNAVDVSTYMTIQDSANNLKSDFENILDNGSICSSINTDKMKEIIYRYDNCLSSSELSLLSSMTFKDSENNDMSIVSALEYARNKLGLSNNSVSNLVSNVLRKGNETIIIFAVISTLLLGFALFYSYKKKAKQ